MRLGQSRRIFHQVEQVHHGIERVLDFVGDSCRESVYEGEFLARSKDGFRASTIGDVAKDEYDAVEVSTGSDDRGGRFFNHATLSVAPGQYRGAEPRAAILPGADEFSWVGDRLTSLLFKQIHYTSDGEAASFA